ALRDKEMGKAGRSTTLHGATGTLPAGRHTVHRLTACLWLHTGAFATPTCSLINVSHKRDTVGECTSRFYKYFFSCVRFPSFFACQDGRWDTQFGSVAFFL